MRDPERGHARWSHARWARIAPCSRARARAIPALLSGRDLLGIAQTGTGKTAAFVLPMLSLLEKGRARARMPRTLILEPTRELADQVREALEADPAFILRHGFTYSGHPVCSAAALANLGVRHLSEAYREEVMRATGGAVATTGVGFALVSVSFSR